MKVLGVDPSIRGGLAIVELNNGAAPQLVDAIDIPVAGVGAKERVDVLALRACLVTHEAQHALIERAQRCLLRAGSSTASPSEPSSFPREREAPPGARNPVREPWRQ